MSGQDVVRARRENGDLNKGGGPGGGFSLDYVIGFIAIAAVAACAWVAIDMFLLRGAPPPQTVAAKAPIGDLPVWEASDDATCGRWIRQAQSEDDPDAYAMADPVITDGGYAALAANLDCHASVKVARLCDPEQKTALIALVNDFMSRRDLLSLTLEAQGAPMKVMGSMMGGEVAFGSSVYDMTKDNTLAYMAFHDQRVAKSLRALATGGILTTNDFSFYGHGVPPSIAEIFKGVTVTEQVCS